MRSTFLSPEQIAEGGLKIFERVGIAAPASDMAVMTCVDDGFLLEPAGGINYYLLGGGFVDRFGRGDKCDECAVRPVIELENGDARLLRDTRKDSDLPIMEFGHYPTVVLDSSLREMAMREYEAGTLRQSGKKISVRGQKLPVYSLGAKLIVAVALEQTGASGFVQLSDGTVVVESEVVFLELRPVRWLYDKEASLLVSCQALFGGLSREDALRYLGSDFLSELDSAEEAVSTAGKSYRIETHNELSLIRAYVEADIPVFLHGLSGDGKSDRVRQIDPQALDIELVNENPETINGRAIYNEARDEIVDIKPVWLVKLERLCEDGELHILFFDELTNATKQTQSVIFKIVLERFVNNRWPLPKNARIVAAGNERSESSAAHDLAEPLFGRFAHIYIRTTVENWMPWAVGENINPYVLEFLANNDLYLRTAYTGTEGNADPRRWEMVSKVLDSSGNDFSLLAPIVGRDTADAFIRFFKAQEEAAELGTYTDEEIKKFSVARRYQLAQQCLMVEPVKPKEARELVTRLGREYLSWYEYILSRRGAIE